MTYTGNGRSTRRKSGRELQVRHTSNYLLVHMTRADLAVGFVVRIDAIDEAITAAERLTAIGDALAFRRERDRLFSAAATEEGALEIHKKECSKVGQLRLLFPLEVNRTIPMLVGFSGGTAFPLPKGVGTLAPKLLLCLMPEFVCSPIGSISPLPT